MSKYLILVCDDCGKERRFAGGNATEIMAAIDANEWQDLPGGHALCPACAAAEELAAYQEAGRAE